MKKKIRIIAHTKILFSKDVKAYLQVDLVCQKQKVFLPKIENISTVRKLRFTSCRIRNDSAWPILLIGRS